MPEDDPIQAFFKQYFEKLKTDSAIVTVKDSPDDEAINKLLGNMSRRDEANAYIDAEVSSYKRRLYYLAKAAAESDGEIHIITKSHAERARLMIDQKKSGLDWSDGLIGIGGAFLGAAIPHIFDLLDNPQPQVKVWLLIFGLIGALMSGVGFNQKARR